MIVVGSQAILGTFATRISLRWSPFEKTHGFSIDGVDLETWVLPAGWRDHLVRVQNDNTGAPGGEPQFTGRCVDSVDLCVAKLCAFREKDRNFVAALLEAKLVDPDAIAQRLPTVDDRHLPRADAVVRWIEARSNG